MAVVGKGVGRRAFEELANRHCAKWTVTGESWGTSHLNAPGVQPSKKLLVHLSCAASSDERRSRRGTITLMDHTCIFKDNVCQADNCGLIEPDYEARVFKRMFGVDMKPVPKFVLADNGEIISEEENGYLEARALTQND